MTAPEAAMPGLRFDIFTLFPGMFPGPFNESIIKRAVALGLIDIHIHDIRDWTTDKHRTADDTPYGGGAGMVMTAPPIVAAVEAVLGAELGTTSILVMAAGGRPFRQSTAQSLTTASRIAVICGRYEGVDQRVIEILRAEEVAIGDFVVTGGELPAMIVVDAVTRLLPGVINASSVDDESHQAGLVEYPHYTRPPTVRGLSPPPVLLTGNHAEIARWRRQQAIQRTARLRPDLLPNARLSEAERRWLEELEEP